MNHSDKSNFDLSTKRKALLETLLVESGVRPHTSHTIPRRNATESIPLSFAQQRIWFLDRLNPGCAAYNIHEVLRLQGSLDQNALQQSLNEMVRRHEVLRTSFVALNDEPVQVVHPQQTVNLRVIDLQQLPAAEQQKQAINYSEEQGAGKFDLAQDPLLRATLVLLNPQEALLLLTIHHIVADGWSMRILSHELWTLYEAYSNRKTSALPELPIQYADFALWQRRWLKEDILQSQLSYWTKKLENCTTFLRLPTDRPRPTVQNFRGEREGFAVSADITNRLKSFSNSEGGTLFMTLLAAFNAILYRYTGQEDILVGTPIANRNRIEIENLVGFFANTLVLRTDLSNSPTFRDLFIRVRETALEAYSYQDLPFERLVEELHPERSLSYTPLFQVMFALQNISTHIPALSFLRVTRIPVNPRTAQFDLTLTMFESEQGLKGSFEFASDLFDASTIKRLAGHFILLLEEVSTDPGRRLSALKTLTEAEKTQILVEWNRTNVKRSDTACIHNLVTEQAQRTPEAVAVVHGKNSLTYRSLNESSNQLAAYLRKKGGGPERFVGLLMEPSIEMMIALLGILKTGAAYVPLDSNYPKERLAHILSNVEPDCILTQEHLRLNLPDTRSDVICFDSEWQKISLEDTELLDDNITPENPANVIFTSGSTGLPKGVVTLHRGLLNQSLAAMSYYEVKPTDRVLQFASLSFDVAAEEIFPTWIAGATVVLKTDPIFFSTQSFTRFIHEQEITLLNLPTSFWKEWAHQVHYLKEKLPTSLRTVIIGSEKAATTSLSKWYEIAGSKIRLINAYGPTETTVGSTVFDATNASDLADTYPSVPIGKPIANTQVYVLDSNLEPVPVGVPGELFIAGAGLARGYLKHPDLTVQKFIPNPFASEPGDRLYRTGDLVKYLADGNIQFLDRMDHQVKIRGFRVEPGEIEAVLRSHPSICEAVIMVREDTPGDHRLVAYLVPDDAHALEISGLRQLLKQRLPAFMIPDSWVILDSLPLTRNGKINFKALPSPDAGPVEQRPGYVAPRSPIELQLVKIWEKILGKKPVGISDNFFDLGGHSLLAVRLFTEIERIAEKNLPLVTLFQAPTIEQLTVILADSGWSPPWSSLVPIQPEGFEPPFYCIHGVGGNVVEYSQLAKHLGPNQPLYGIQAQGLDGKRPRHSSVEEMAQYYIDEIRKFQPQGPYYLGGSSFGGVVAFEMACQLRLQGEMIGLLALFDTNGPGYRKPLPTTSAFKQRLYSLRQRIDLHVGNLRLLEPELRAEYIQEKTEKVRRRIRIRMRYATSKVREMLGMSVLPKAIRNVQHSGRKAAKNYQPKPYPGRIILFRATQQPLGIYPDPNLGWGELALGGLEIHDIPGYHGAIIREPRVRVLAEKLIVCLREARKGLENGGGTHVSSSSLS